MTWGFSLAVGIAVALGYLLVASLGVHRPLVLVASLAIALGLGCSSCLYFAWCVFAPANDHRYIWVEISCLALLSISAHRARSLERETVTAVVHRPWWWTFAGVFAVGALLSGVLFAVQSSANPAGEWDAWCVWTNRATLIYRAHDPWLPLIRRLPEVFNPSYPLLVPLSISRLWLYAGGEPPAAAVTVAGMFCLATVGLITAGLSVVRSSVQGFLAGLVVVTTPVFVRLSANQYADSPVSTYFLAAAVLWAWAEMSDGRERRARFALAGCAAALAAWTKNEGTLFLAAFFAVMALPVGTAVDRRRRFQDLLAGGLGAVPVLLAVAFFKAAYAPPDRWAAHVLSSSTLTKIADVSRYLQILGSAASNFRVLPWPLLAVYAFLMGPVQDAAVRRPAYAVTGLLALLVLGYASVFLTSPWDLTWHLATASTRTCYQLWPLGVFLTFLLARDAAPLLTPRSR